MTHIARREFLSSLLFASVQSIVPASMQGASGRESSAKVLDKHDFERVRQRILGEIAAGAATGVAVAVAPIIITPELRGHWQGRLTNDGLKMQVRFNLESPDSATLQLGEKPAEKITEMHLEGVGFTGASTGLVESRMQNAPERRR